ncbi:hypothetical protein [Thalassobaculum sp.]|uniref:hypothetical protein n=1 Tax=Thalassobaculum sp. TaxID=2022740 RepID=UPI0032ED1A14
MSLAETGLVDHVREVFTNPADEAALRPLNPLGKIPALKTSDAGTLYASPVTSRSGPPTGGTHPGPP